MTNEGMNYKVQQCGLMISAEHRYLAASPDGIVTCGGEKVGLLEVKNVLRNKRLNLIQAAQQQKGATFCLEVVAENKLQLKIKHPYCCQCQGQLLVCQMEWVDFVGRCSDPQDLFVERVTVDKELILAMQRKLKSFYFKKWKVA